MTEIDFKVKVTEVSSNELDRYGSPRLSSPAAADRHGVDHEGRRKSHRLSEHCVLHWS